MPLPPPPLRPWLLLLAALTALRLVVAGTAPLSPDEAYYWVWSRALAPGFLDHPPMVALWIASGTALLGPNALGVRLLAPLSAAAGSLLLAGAARDLLPDPAGAPPEDWRRPGVGVRAACLLNATLMLGAGAVTMTPDTPLLFFWSAALWGMGRLLRTGRGGWWLVVGAAAGCALESKYTAVLLGGGLAAWLLLVPEGRGWLRRWQPWGALALALALFAPDLLWNAVHGWASLRKQGGRVGDWRPARALGFLLELLGGQVGLLTPGVFALGVLGTWRGVRLWPRPGPALLCCLVLLPAAVFVQHALGDRVQANWPAVLLPAVAVLAAGLAARFWVPAAVLGLLLTAPVYLQATAAPLLLPPRLDPTLTRLGGWGGLARAVAAASRGEAGEAPAFMAADEYGLAAELAWRLRRGPPLPVLGTEERWRLFALPRAVPGSAEGLLLRSARRAGPPDPALWAEAREVERIARTRDGVTAEEYRLYRVIARPGLPAVVLPRPDRAAPGR